MTPCKKMQLQFDRLDVKMLDQKITPLARLTYLYSRQNSTLKISPTDIAIKVNFIKFSLFFTTLSDNRVTDCVAENSYYLSKFPGGSTNSHT